MSAAALPLEEAFLCHADITDTVAIPGRTDPNRVTLLSEYLALQPSQASHRAAVKESASCRAADRLAARLNRARELELVESPSEKKLVDNALAKCKKEVADGIDSMRSSDDLRQQQQCILAMLYPNHPVLDPVLVALSDIRRRNSMLRRAIRDQTQALAKLNDASNLLLLISDHVEILSSCCANSCSSSSSSDWSSEDDAVRVGCLGRGDDSRALIFISSVPGNYRIRYLRKCWGFAADALSAAVDLSSYLARQLQHEGRSELVPGIEVQARPSMSLFELPGGLTFFFRSDLLQKMASDAKEMREAVQVWQLRQRKFLSRVRRDLSKTKRRAAAHEARLAEARRALLSEEFADSYPLPS